jgi:hypothetical protein
MLSEEETFEKELLRTLVMSAKKTTLIGIISDIV